MVQLVSVAAPSSRNIPALFPVLPLMVQPKSVAVPRSRIPLAVLLLTVHWFKVSAAFGLMITAPASVLLPAALAPPLIVSPEKDAFAPSAAFAACSPGTGDNVTVTCSGTTQDQGPGINTGYGNGLQNGLTINVVASPPASVIGTSVGIDVNSGNTINNFGTITTAGVTNPAPLAVYKNERYGAFTYTIPGLTPGGTYTVRLHFVEIFWSAAGQRNFNVNINGTRVLSAFDIFAAAGGANKVTVQSFTATANASGQISVTYSNGSADQPKSSAIAVSARATAGSAR